MTNANVSVITKVPFISSETNFNVGEFIQGRYHNYYVYGVILKVNKSAIVVKQCSKIDNNYTFTDTIINVNKKRVHKVSANITDIL